MNYYQHHIGDYRSSTAHLSNEEDLAYRRLLEMYYDTEQPIPLDTQWVSRRLRVLTETLEAVLNDFFVKQESGYMHARCEAEIAGYRQKGKTARENGRKGGRRKAAPMLEENLLGSESVPVANPRPAQPLTNQEPITNNQEPIKKKKESARAQAVACPPDVDAQVWKDWCQLRKAKRAPVNPTVIDGARREAAKAEMTLGEFLAVWCRRGSQGLEADWLKPAERRQAKADPRIDGVYTNLDKIKYTKGVTSL